MTAHVMMESELQPTTLQEALNLIKFITSTHKQETKKLKDTIQKQREAIKKLESNRKKELEFLAKELQNYEINLALRTESVAQQLAQKDEIIRKQTEMIEELNKKIKSAVPDEFTVPEITVGDSNSDSGVAMDESNKSEDIKTEAKTIRKCSRRFADSISFLRRVDFSPMKYKPCNREGGKKKEEVKKTNLEVPTVNKRVLTRQYSNDRPTSDDDRLVTEESILSDGPEPILIRPKPMNDSMNNHFSDDGSEDTSEEVFDRVMTRSSIRRSVKANPKYKKINRTKSKLLEHIKVNMVDKASHCNEPIANILL